MKLHFLGTCAGTEPMPDRNHQSFAIETNGALYWFDAGAHCSATAHLMGLDLLSVKKVIISHTHMDHVGGLGNLFWDIRKLKHVKNQETKFDEITLYIPEMETWEGFSKILRNTEGGFNGMKTVGIYDKYNYGQEEMKKIAIEYIAEDETLKKLIDNNCI